MLAMGFLQVIGQISIYYVIANFKQHVFPLISTTRKIITVILSIIVYNHTLAQLQYLAIAIVFTGMFYELYEEIMHEKSEDESSQSAKVEESATDRSDSPTRTKEE